MASRIKSERLEGLATHSEGQTTRQEEHVPVNTLKNDLITSVLVLSQLFFSFFFLNVGSMLGMGLELMTVRSRPEPRSRTGDTSLTEPPRRFNALSQLLQHLSLAVILKVGYLQCPSLIAIFTWIFLFFCELCQSVESRNCCSLSFSSSVILSSIRHIR